MNEHEYWEFKHNAVHRLIDLNNQLETTFKIGTYQRWDYDQETGEFVFSDDAVPKVVARFQVVGSFSTETKTWLWSWANAYIMETACDQMHRVREFGLSHDVTKLTDAKWDADEADGWEMTAISASIIGAKGAYRCPSKNGFMFVVYTDIHFAEN
ncbi:MAG: DUF6882 domain-containing protein [Terriglobales bacterium]